MFGKSPSRLSASIAVSVVAALLLSMVSTVSRVHEFNAINSTATAALHAQAIAAFDTKAELLVIADLIDAKVAAAEGKVLDDQILAVETARAEKFRAVAAQLHQIGVAGEAAVDAGTIRSAAWYWEYEVALELLDSVDFSPGVSSASKLMAGRTTHASVIANAVAAWEVEQARIDAELARQARIDAELALLALVARSAAAVPTASSTSGVYSVYVRTVANASNAQATIDAGGQIAVNYGDGSGVFVSAHNYDDSTALLLKVGDIVIFSGAASGTYRVTGSKDVNKYGSTTADVRSLDVSMMMQTCYFGTDLMRVVGMVPA